MSVSRNGGSRVQMRRIYEILDEVKKGGFPNCRSLADKFEFSQKTIQRDVTFMQDQLGIPILYNGSKHGYELQEGGEVFPVFEAQAEDLAALFLLRHAMKSVEGTMLAETLQPVFERLSRQLDGRVNMDWRDLDRVFSVKASGSLDADLALLGKLAEAVLNEREVSFHYRKLGDGEARLRRLRPYHVGEIGGGWYVIGHDLDRGALRTFAMQRIENPEILKTTFSRPEDFHISDYIGGSLGAWSHDEAEPVEVVIRVSGWMARIVQERPWHESQSVDVLDDQGEQVELRMKLHSLEEVKRLLLGWGRYAEVVKPSKLRDAVKNEAAQIMNNYK